MNLDRFNSGDTNYITKHNANCAKIESAVNKNSQEITSLKSATSLQSALDYRQLAQNLVINGNFEYWIKDNILPSVWQRETEDLSFATSRDGINVFANNYSVKLENEGRIKQELKIAKQTIVGSQFQFGCYVKTSSLDSARIGISVDGIDNFSSFHSGSDEFELLTVSYTHGNNEFPIDIEIFLENESGIAIFNSAICIRGNPQNGVFYVANDEIIEKIRVSAYIEQGFTSFECKNTLDQKCAHYISFKVEKIEIPEITILSDLETPLDYEIFNVSEYGFGLRIINTVLDDTVIENLTWLAEVV